MTATAWMRPRDELGRFAPVPFTVATVRRLRTAPLRELSDSEVAEAHRRGYIDERMYRSERWRRMWDRIEAAGSLRAALAEELRGGS